MKTKFKFLLFIAGAFALFSAIAPNQISFQVTYSFGHMKIMQSNSIILK